MRVAGKRVTKRLKADSRYFVPQFWNDKKGKKGEKGGI